jgi:hypothetical protein
MSRQKKRLARVLGLVALAAAIGAGCADWYVDWSEPSVAETQLRGNRIVAALDAYARDNLGYPSDLDLLVPKYLPGIPPPLAGDRQWKYTTNANASGFDLVFEGPSDNHPSFIYSSTTNSWQRKSQ